LGDSRLAGFGLFSDLSSDEIELLETDMRFDRLPVGTVLVEQGDIPTKFFVLVAGHVTVHRDGTHIADLGPGDFFGEMGVLALEERNATVIATTPIEVAQMMGWRLRETLEDSPDLREALKKAVGERKP
jgi:CRP/FNR family transcriptional regulator, cyclic AMP receptor protein